jgi:hypothetical protein
MNPVRFAYAGLLTIVLVTGGYSQTDSIDTYAKLLEVAARVESYRSLPESDRMAVLPLAGLLITEARDFEELLPEYNPIRIVKTDIDALMEKIEGDPTKDDIDQLRALIETAHQAVKSASPALERRVSSLVISAIRAFEAGLSSQVKVELHAAERAFAKAFAEEFETLDPGGESCVVGSSTTLTPVSRVFSDFARKVAGRRPDMFVSFANGKLEVECEGLVDRSIEVLAESRKGEVIPLVNACLAANDYETLLRGTTAVGLWPRSEWLPLVVSAVKRGGSLGIGEAISDLVRAYGIRGVRAFYRARSELSSDSKLRFVWSLWQNPSSESVRVLERAAKESTELSIAALDSISRMFDEGELEDNSPEFSRPSRNDWLAVVRIAQGLTRHADPDIRDASHEVLKELREYGNAVGYR